MRPITLLVAIASAGHAQSLYRDHIRPVLEKQCQVCHNSATKQGGLDLSSREKMLRGGDRGPAVTPGDAGESLLYAYITHKRQPGMPMGGKQLAPELIARFAEWIKAGAPFDDKLNARPVESSHWSFRKPRRTAAPQVSNAVWAANPVDAFLSAEHERLGLKPLPETDRYSLLRRVYLDLIGLPPTPAQVQNFLNDKYEA